MTSSGGKKTTHPLHPLNSIVFVSSADQFTKILPAVISQELVGDKAFGLSAIPAKWGLPFIVVSKEFLSGYRQADNRSEFLSSWMKQIQSALASCGFTAEDSVLIRSSACGEGLQERGCFHSCDGEVSSLLQTLAEYLRITLADEELARHEIPLIIQKYIKQHAAKGHLSNERRFFEEKRDWFGEIEQGELLAKQPFAINLREWRKKIELDPLMEQPLECNVIACIPDSLRVPATWGVSLGLRLHFEWVSDGKSVYLVQADEERESAGENPAVLITTSAAPKQEKYAPKCLKLVDKSCGGQYHKIKNIQVYKNLSLPTADLYILDDQRIIDSIAKNIIPVELREDLSVLASRSLVIRTDLEVEDVGSRQLLPRTNEVRDVGAAIDFLAKTSCDFKAKFPDVNIAFILHNFIPAVSAAFAYAAPGERKVQIEALWGLPEGLYYNAHDKYVVDTLTAVFGSGVEKSIERFVVKETRNYKTFFVAPNRDGAWAMKRLKSPYDWRGSIQKQEWIRKIALDSRKIAESEGKALSIMWFVGVPKVVCDSEVFPWYHEVYDIKITRDAQACRSKTSFDKALEIKTKKDVESLTAEAQAACSNVRLIKIQPHEDVLLREKNTLHEIGKLAQKIGATIRLEGGLLSHAYYQLVKTGAAVEVAFPFKDTDDRREFNKLVRDKVPSRVEENGEIAQTVAISGDDLLRALRDKLIEESFETLDAAGRDAIVSELVDVCEVVDGILGQVGISRAELMERQKIKRERNGGFASGVVLVKTENPLPAVKKVDSPNEDLLFEMPGEPPKEPGVETKKIIDESHAISKWSDKKKHSDSDEYVLKIVSPAVSDAWTASTSGSIFDSLPDTPIRAKLTGRRLGAQYQVELSIMLKHKSMRML